MKNQNPSIDLFALKRDKEMTPGARLDWLAAALNFVRGVERARKQPPAKQR